MRPPRWSPAAVSWPVSIACRLAGVALLNYELTSDDQRACIRALDLNTGDLARLLIVNLRGARLSITTPTGRDWLIACLADHGAQVVILDTYGAAAAPSVDNENDNGGARRFLATLDEIKARAAAHRRC